MPSSEQIETAQRNLAMDLPRAVDQPTSSLLTEKTNRQPPAEQAADHLSRRAVEVSGDSRTEQYRGQCTATIAPMLRQPPADILLVDDNDTGRRLLARLLREAGFR